MSKKTDEEFIQVMKETLNKLDHVVHNNINKLHTNTGINERHHMNYYMNCALAVAVGCIKTVCYTHQESEHMIRELFIKGLDQELALRSDKGPDEMRSTVLTEES